MAEKSEEVVLRKNDATTSLIKILVEHIVDEYSGQCVALELATGEKHYFHWDLPRLTHIMVRDSDGSLFNDAPVHLHINAREDGRMVVTRVR